MPTIGDVRDEISKTLASGRVPTPLYAVAGAGDLAVEKLRGAQARIAELRPDRTFAQLPSRVQGLRGDVEARVREAASTASSRATGAYDGLTTRGKKLAGRIGSQQATRDLTQGTEEVARSVKATVTTVEHGVTNTRKATKRTATTAKKTAGTARKAVADAVEKTGETRSAKKSTPRKRD